MAHLPASGTLGRTPFLASIYEGGSSEDGNRSSAAVEGIHRCRAVLDAYEPWNIIDGLGIRRRRRFQLCHLPILGRNESLNNGYRTVLREVGIARVGAKSIE